MLPLSCIISIITKKINYLVRLDKNKIISVNHYRSVKTINVEHEMTEGLRNICTAYFCCITDAANIFFSLQYRVIIPHINNSTWKFGFKKKFKSNHFMIFGFHCQCISHQFCLNFRYPQLYMPHQTGLRHILNMLVFTAWSYPVVLCNQLLLYHHH